MYGSMAVVPTTHVGDAVTATPIAIEFRDMSVKCTSNTPLPGVDSSAASGNGDTIVPVEEYSEAAGPERK